MKVQCGSRSFPISTLCISVPCASPSHVHLRPVCTSDSFNNKAPRVSKIQCTYSSTRKIHPLEKHFIHTFFWSGTVLGNGDAGFKYTYLYQSLPPNGIDDKGNSHSGVICVLKEGNKGAKQHQSPTPPFPGELRPEVTFKGAGRNKQGKRKGGLPVRDGTRT